MTFLAPGRLWLLAGVVLLGAAYVVLQRRRRHYAVRFTNLDLLASVAPRRPGWRRHLPAALVALSLAGTVVGLARPARSERVPQEAAAVMLVIDTSVSMEATDVAPSRLEAAASAARRFIDDLPPRIEVGLVAFDGTPRVLARPTTDHATVAAAVDRLVTGPGTAAGDALYAALAAIDAPGVGPPAGDGDTGGAAIVLLSDGVTTVGRPVEEAAAAAAEQRVPVTTIAFGTDAGTVDVEGRTVPVPADRDTMTAVAGATGGTFFEAFSADELRRVYEDIGARIGYVTEQRELGMAVVGGALALLVAALVAAMVWGGRVL